MQRCPGGKQDNYCTTCLRRRTLLKDWACAWFPSPNSYFLRGNEEQWIGGITMDQRIQLQKFVSFAFPFVFFLVSLFCPSCSHFMRNETLCFYLWGSNKRMRREDSHFYSGRLKGDQGIKTVESWSHIREKSSDMLSQTVKYEPTKQET